MLAEIYLKLDCPHIASRYIPEVRVHEIHSFTVTQAFANAIEQFRKIVFNFKIDSDDPTMFFPIKNGKVRCDWFILKMNQSNSVVRQIRFNGDIYWICEELDCYILEDDMDKPFPEYYVKYNLKKRMAVI